MPTSPMCPAPITRLDQIPHTLGTDQSCPVCEQVFTALADNVKDRHSYDEGMREEWERTCSEVNDAAFGERV